MVNTLKNEHEYVLVEVVGISSSRLLVDESEIKILSGYSTIIVFSFFLFLPITWNESKAVFRPTSCKTFNSGVAVARSETP